MSSLDVGSSSEEEQAAKMAVAIMINNTFFIVLSFFLWVSKMVAKVLNKNERHKFSDKKMLVNL